jgi:formylglycine-generating enzyme required for sulfatase activity
VPLEADGSAMFRVPANTPLAVQPLDAEGKAVQLMRSWFTVMPGETASCIGCHESPADVPSPAPALATRQPVRDLTPWYGPARGFDFAREVQPVLDKYCVSCHGSTELTAGGSTALTTGDGSQTNRPDLRAEVPGYRGRRVSQLEIDRLPPQVRAATQGVLKYTPAYEALLPYVRRVGIEDDVSLLTPGEYHADTSPLIRMLRQGHHGVVLDAEAWDRLVTWIDLNSPCHGTWHEVYPIPDGAHERRMALRQQCGGPTEDPEIIPVLPRPTMAALAPNAAAAVAAPAPAPVAPPQGQTFDLGGGVTLQLVRVAAEKPFWIGTCEVSNGQFRKFDPHHDSRYYQKRYPPLSNNAVKHIGPDALPLTLNDDRQPVVRVSWEQAMAFCRWLSARTRQHFTLPTEAQWACCAGKLDEDFSGAANLADAAFSKGLGPDGKQYTGGLEHLVLEGAALADARYNDGHIVTAPIGSLRPNAWGLCDMFGNAAEWTSTPAGTGRYVVRGGSFFDPPRRAGARLDYPAWQRVFDVGFRVVTASAAPVTTVSK